MFQNSLTDSQASLVAQTAKSPPATPEIWVQSLDQEDSPAVGNGNPLEYSCLENSMDRGAWWTTVSGVAKSWTPGVSNKHIFFSPSPWQTTSYLHICHLTTLTPCIAGILKLFVFLWLLISLNIISSSFIHLVASFQSQFPSFIF